MSQCVGDLRQEYCEFKVSMDYTVRSCPTKSKQNATKTPATSPTTKQHFTAFKRPTKKDKIITNDDGDVEKEEPYMLLVGM